MTREHYRDDELLAYLDFNGDVVDVERIARHLSSCDDDCNERLSDLRTLTALFSDPTVHAFSRRSDRVVSRDEVFELQRYEEARRCSRDAEAAFAALLGRPVESWPWYLEATTSAEECEQLVRRIVADARQRLDRSPERALDLLNGAAEIANALPDGPAAAEERAALEKERANALRMLGRYRDALAALDAATLLLRRLPAPTYDLAFIEWGRATVLFGMSRYSEALGLARAVTRTFRSFGDIERAQQVRVLEATILCDQGEVLIARTAYRELAEYFRNAGDRELVARITANLAECEVRLDHPEDATRFAAAAMREYEALHKPVEKIRVHWSLGYSLMRQGYDDAAADALSGAAAAFRNFGMLAEAADVELDMAELLLRRGDWLGVERLARNAAAVFASSDAPVHRARAFGYLQEAVANRTATVDLVAYIRAYVVRAKWDSDAPFEPPAS